MMRCDVRRGYGTPCGARLVERVDRLGRLVLECPACARRLAGICATCPRRVVGAIGKALFCASCKRVRRKQVALAHWHRHGEANRAKKRRRERLDADRPLSRQEAGRRGGLVSGPRIAAARTPEQRRAIARLGGLKGGPASQAKRTPEERRALARRANHIRYHGACA